MNSDDEAGGGGRALLSESDEEALMQAEGEAVYVEGDSGSDSDDDEYSPGGPSPGGRAALAGAALRAAGGQQVSPVNAWRSVVLPGSFLGAVCGISSPTRSQL